MIPTAKDFSPDEQVCIVTDTRQTPWVVVSTDIPKNKVTITRQEITRSGQRTVSKTVVASQLRKLMPGA